MTVTTIRFNRKKCHRCENNPWLVDRRLWFCSDACKHAFEVEVTLRSPRGRTGISLLPIGVLLELRSTSTHPYGIWELPAPYGVGKSGERLFVSLQAYSRTLSAPVLEDLCDRRPLFWGRRIYSLRQYEESIHAPCLQSWIPNK